MEKLLSLMVKDGEYVTDAMFAHKVEELKVLFIRRRRLRREMKDTKSLHLHVALIQALNIVDQETAIILEVKGVE